MKTSKLRTSALVATVAVMLSGMTVAQSPSLTQPNPSLTQPNNSAELRMAFPTRR